MNTNLSALIHPERWTFVCPRCGPEAEVPCPAAVCQMLAFGCQRCWTAEPTHSVVPYVPHARWLLCNGCTIELTIGSSDTRSAITCLDVPCGLHRPPPPPPQPPGISVLVASYNRPTMLAEAVASIVGADQIVIMDDGSTFDVRAVVSKATTTPVKYILNPPIPPQVRATTHHPGFLYNRAIFAADHAIITYLCDDDVFAPEWLPALRTYFFEHPEAHIVRGDWNILGTDRSSFMPGRPWQLTTGNFAYRASCATGNEGCLWDTTTIGVHDATMLGKFLAVHKLEDGGQNVPDIGVLAGWRREHAMNMVNWTMTGGLYKPGAVNILGGTLE